MPCSYDVLIRGLSLDFIPVQTRVPLKFGTEVLASVTCSRVCIEVEGRNGSKAKGWGETPLSVQWVWPSELTYVERHQALIEFLESAHQAFLLPLPALLNKGVQLRTE